MLNSKVIIYHNLLIIKQYRKIKLLNNDNIIIELSNIMNKKMIEINDLEITGSNLIVMYLDEEVIKIDGTIKTISFINT